MPKKSEAVYRSSPRKTCQWRIRGHRGLHGLKNADLHGFRPFGSGSVPKKEDLIQSIMARWWFQLFLFNLYPETGGRWSILIRNIFLVKVELVHRGIIFHRTTFTCKEKPRNVHNLFCFRLLCRSHHRKMSAEHMGLFWALVDTCKFDKALKCLVSNFQYDALHPERGTTLLLETIYSGLCAPPGRAQNCLELIKALRSGGASWTQTCKEDAPEDTIAGPKSIEVTVDCGSLSALSYIQAWLCKFGTKKLWRDAVSFLHKVLDCYWVELESHPQRHKLAIDEDIASKLRRSQVCFFWARFANMSGDPHCWVRQNYPLSHQKNSLLLIQVWFGWYCFYLPHIFPHAHVFWERIWQT